MSTLASCDPGNDAGLASFVDGRLTWCGLNMPPQWPLGHWKKADRLVVEIPNANEKRKRGNPQSLITLAITAGRWIERIPHDRLTLEFPSEWKGSVPKDTHNGLVLAALEVDERAVLARCMQIQNVAQGKLHNVVDAIGIGLEALGRIGRGGRPR